MAFLAEEIYVQQRAIITKLIDFLNTNKNVYAVLFFLISKVMLGFGSHED